VLEDPAAIPPNGIYKMTRDLNRTEDYPIVIDINFKNGEFLTSHITLIPNARSRQKHLPKVQFCFIFIHTHISLVSDLGLTRINDPYKHTFLRKQEDLLILVNSAKQFNI
jgi:hypothetical protein